jgi:hypothetical protein
MTTFYFDGERLIQVDQIEAVEGIVREKVGEPEAYGDRPPVVEVEARVIRTISGREYISDGSVLDVIDMLMHGSPTGEEQIA